MKTVPLRDMKQELSGYVAKSQKDCILITKHGRPAAVVWGVEGKDMEDIFYMTSRAFWSIIRRRRRERPIPWSKAKRMMAE